MSSATQLCLSQVSGPNLINPKGLSSIDVLNDAPWNHDGHPKDLFLQPSGPSPMENHPTFLESFLKDSISSKTSAFQQAFTRPMLVPPAHPQLIMSGPNLRSLPFSVDNPKQALFRSPVFIVQTTLGPICYLWSHALQWPPLRAPLWFFRNPSVAVTTTQQPSLLVVVLLPSPCQQ